MVVTRRQLAKRKEKFSVASVYIFHKLVTSRSNY